MDVLVNNEKKMVCCILPRCGSNHVRSVLKTVNWVENRRVLIKSFEDYKIIKIVRDPYERWVSWFYAFVWDENSTIKNWTVAEAEQWLEDFRVRHHYDEHTGLQSMLYNFNNPYINDNTHYVRMEYVDMYFGLSEQRHPSVVQHFPRIDETHPDVVEYFKHAIPELYKPDYNWMKNLDIWEKSS